MLSPDAVGEGQPPGSDRAPSAGSARFLQPVLLLLLLLDSCAAKEEGLRGGREVRSTLLLGVLRRPAEARSAAGLYAVRAVPTLGAGQSSMQGAAGLAGTVRLSSMSASHCCSLRRPPVGNSRRAVGRGARGAPGGGRTAGIMWALGVLHSSPAPLSWGTAAAAGADAGAFAAADAAGMVMLSAALRERWAVSLAGLAAGELSSCAAAGEANFCAAAAQGKVGELQALCTDEYMGLLVALAEALTWPSARSEMLLAPLSSTRLLG